MRVHSIPGGRAAGRISATVVALALALADTPVRAAAPEVEAGSATRTVAVPAAVPEVEAGPAAGEVQAVEDGPATGEVPRDEPAPRGPVEVDTGGLPVELVAPPVAALVEARRLAAAQRFAAAAAIHEAQWRATGDPRFLYHAALLRARAGHHAVALQHLVKCVAEFSARGGGQIAEPLRGHLEAAREREFAATRPVRLRLVEATTGGLQPVPDALLGPARVVIQRAGLPEEHVPGNRIEVDGANHGELRLDPGPWIVRVEIPGFVAAEAERTVEDGPGAWEVVVQRREVVVELRFAPERALWRARLRLEASDHASPLAFERALRGPTATARLATGPWRLEVAGRRHQAAMNLTIQPGQPAIAVTLQRRAPGPDDGRLRRDPKLAAGLAGSLGVVYIVGLGLILGGTNREQRAEERDAAAYEAAGLDRKMPGPIDAGAAAAIEAAYPAAQLHRELAAATRLHTAGIVVSGMSVGAIGAALPVAFGARRRTAYILLAAGGTALAGGASWLAWSLPRRAGLLDDPGQRVGAAEYDRGDGHRIAAAMFTGAGLGLVAFTGIALVADAAGRRRRARGLGAAPLLAPGLAGLSLRGRF